MAAQKNNNLAATVASYMAVKDDDGSQLNGQTTVASYMAASTPPTENRPLLGGDFALRVDRTEYATHDETTCRATGSEVVAYPAICDDHFDSFRMEGVTRGRLGFPRDVPQSRRGRRHVTSRVRRLSRSDVRLRLARLARLQPCRCVERVTLLLRLPRGRDERNLSIVQIPRSAHHVTREVSPKKRTNERFTDLLTVRGTGELFGESVRRHNIAHVITSLHNDIVSRHVTSREGTQHKKPANSDIRYHATVTHNMHHVCRFDNVVDIDNTPPPPSVPMLSGWTRPPQSYQIPPKISAYVSALYERSS